MGQGAWPHSHEHSTADQEEEIETIAISKEGVPDTDDIGQQELLGQQQCQPSEGKELRLDTLLLLGDRGVVSGSARQLFKQDPHSLGASPVRALKRAVQSPGPLTGQFQPM